MNGLNIQNCSDIGVIEIRQYYAMNIPFITKNSRNLTKVICIHIFEMNL